jgi:hypothetical protein
MVVTLPLPVEAAAAEVVNAWDERDYDRLSIAIDDELRTALNDLPPSRSENSRSEPE